MVTFVGVGEEFNISVHNNEEQDTENISITMNTLPR